LLLLCQPFNYIYILSKASLHKEESIPTTIDLFSCQKKTIRISRQKKRRGRSARKKKVCLKKEKRKKKKKGKSFVMRKPK